MFIRAGTQGKLSARAAPMLAPGVRFIVRSPLRIRAAELDKGMMLAVAAYACRAARVCLLITEVVIRIGL